MQNSFYVARPSEVLHPRQLQPRSAGATSDDFQDAFFGRVADQVPAIKPSVPKKQRDIGFAQSSQ